MCKSAMHCSSLSRASSLASAKTLSSCLVNFAVFLGDGKWGKGNFIIVMPFVSEEWHNNLRNIASKSRPQKRR